MNLRNVLETLFNYAFFFLFLFDLIFHVSRKYLTLHGSWLARVGGCFLGDFT